MKKIIFITGCHRSGTSLLAFLMSHFSNAELTKNTLEPNKWNSKGYFEDKDFLSLNEKILKYYNCNWKLNTKIDFDKKEFKKTNIYSLLEGFIKKIKKNYSGEIILKDPRFSVTYFLWKQVLVDLKVKYQVVYIIRKPYEVYKSLFSRDSISFFNFSTLYYRSYLIYLENYNSENFTLVSYDGLIRNSQEFKKVLVFLKLKQRKIENYQAFIRKKTSRNQDIPFDSINKFQFLNEFYEDLITGNVLKSKTVVDVHKTFSLENKIDLIFDEKSNSEANFNNNIRLSEILVLLKLKLKTIIKNLLNHFQVTRLIIIFFNNVNKFFPNKNRKNKYFNSQTRIESFYNFTYPNYDFPKISIIIPVYSNLQLTLNCLESIYRNLPDVSFELLIIDDSLSADFSLLELNSSIRYVKNIANIGFLESCNKASRLARGEYLYFLNNDTFVTKGWLDELYDTFLNFSDVGIVGSKLVYPDGKLQEAGCILWSNGTAWNYGRNKSPYDLEFDFLRQVDYCSGASILVRKNLFIKVGGFDPRFKPAYFEDLDLSLSFLSLGFKTLYQPLSEVFHIESASHDSTKKNQLIHKNRVIFFRKWNSLLKNYPAPGSNEVFCANKFQDKKILFIDTDFPNCENDAGSVTTYNLLRFFVRRDYQVSFFSSEGSNNYSLFRSLNRMGVKTINSKFNNLSSYLRSTKNNYSHFFILRPLNFEKYFSIVKNFFPVSRVIYHAIDLHFLREERALALQKSFISSNAIKDIELNCFLKADLAIVHSDVEKLKVLENKKCSHLKNIFVHPLIINVAKSKNSFEDRSGLGFIGNFSHKPNLDAVEYFVKQIFPSVLKKNSEIVLYIAGSNMPLSMHNFASKNIVVLGFVSDLDEFFDRIKINIAPLRFGAGIKGKIGISLGYGVPTITTYIGSEGMNLKNGLSVIEANSEKDFSDKICEVYSNKALWSKISVYGRMHYEKNYSIRASELKLEKILKNLL